MHFDILLILLLFFLDVGDILVNHFLSHHLLLHALRSKLLLVPKDLRIINCEPSKLSRGYLVWLWLNGGRWQLWLVRCGNLMPVLGILLVVKVFAPLNESIDLLIKFTIMHLHQVLIVEWIIIELLKLFCHLVVDLNIGPFAILLLDQICIFGISIELSEPSDFSESLLSFSEGLSLLWVEMERLWLVSCVDLDLIEGS